MAESGASRGDTGSALPQLCCWICSGMAWKGGSGGTPSCVPGGGCSRTSEAAPASAPRRSWGVMVIICASAHEWSECAMPGLRTCLWGGRGEGFIFQLNQPCLFSEL